MIGNEVVSGKLSQSTSEIDISQLNNGIYILSMTIDSSQTTKKNYVC